MPNKYGQPTANERAYIKGKATGQALAFGGAGGVVGGPGVGVAAGAAGYANGAREAIRDLEGGFKPAPGDGVRAVFGLKPKGEGGPS